MSVDDRGHMGLPLTLLGLAFVAYLVTGQPLHAGGHKEFGPFPAMETVAAEEVISRQMEAISARDAEMAYALTTGALHKKFNTAGQFLTEMRFFYRPVYNHQSYKFLEQTKSGDDLIQKVEVRYIPEQAPTVVIYKLQRNTAGAWRIDSFTVLDGDEGQPI